MISQQELRVTTEGRGSLEITAEIQRMVRKSGIRDGLCQVFVLHTSASLMVCENADPTVREDLERFMARVAPDGDPANVHSAEGPDDMPAHIRSVLTGSSIGVPVKAGRCVLGTWQGLFLWEHRLKPHQRKMLVTVLGD